MRIWYFAASGEESDPISESDLAQLFVQGQLRDSTLVWTEGLEDWQPASNFEILFPPQEVHEEDSWDESWDESLEEDWEGMQEETEWVPPVKPSSKMKSANDSVRPWARFFARKIDIALIFLGLDYLYRFLEGYSFDTTFYRGAFMILGFLCLEPLLLVSFGATPGKLILGLQLHHLNGGPITYPKAFMRTLKVLLRGLALGIPLIHLFAMMKSYGELNRDGETSWDREESFVMEYMEFRLGRAVLTAIVVLALGVISVSFSLE